MNSGRVGLTNACKKKKKKRIENAKRAFGKRKHTSQTYTKTQPKHLLHHCVKEFQENTFVL